MKSYIFLSFEDLIDEFNNAEIGCKRYVAVTKFQIHRTTYKQ